MVSQHSWLLAPMAVNAVKKIIDPAKDTNVDLKMIKIIKKLGDTVEVGKSAISESSFTTIWKMQDKWR